MSELNEKVDISAELQTHNQILKNELKAVKSQNLKLTENLEAVSSLLITERKINIQLYINNEHLILINENLTKEIDTLNHGIEQIKYEIDKLTQETSTINNQYKNRPQDDSNLDNLELLNKELVLENKNLRITVENLKNDLIKQENLRRVLHNTIQDLKGNIRVFCRMRPPTRTNKQNLYVFKVLNENYLEIRESLNNRKSYQFCFDHIFPTESTQEEIFEEISQLIQSALDGHNISILTYGQTGSGKTFTIQGTPENPGIIPRTIEELFRLIKNLEISNWYYRVDVSFVEIYNENIYDLLEMTNHCEISFNEIKGATVKNLTTKTIKTIEDFEGLFLIANKNRRTATTDMNQNSSRSHTLTKIVLYGVNSDNNNRNHSSITLVDLAGSESAKFHNDNYNCNNNNSKEVLRLMETKNINKSLSALGNVILALFNNEQYIPYRNSKLTFLLQSSLGGNSKTLMFVNISPFQYCFMESLNTLRFATKVRQVKNSNKRHQI